MVILLWAIGVLGACIAVILNAILSAKKDKDLTFVDHSSRFINRAIFALICSLIGLCFVFLYLRDNAYHYQAIDLIFNCLMYLFFLMVALGFLFSLVFDYVKNILEGKDADYIGNTATFDILARFLFKRASVYNWIKIIAFCFFILFNYLVTFHLYE